jgi:hypothetical protein
LRAIALFGAGSSISLNGYEKRLKPLPPALVSSKMTLLLGVIFWYSETEGFEQKDEVSKGFQK